MINTRQAALVYIGRLWSPVPIPRGLKGPRQSGWQTLRLTGADAARFDCNGNVGVLLGRASSELMDVDLDCAAAVALAPMFLPPTASKFGRQSKRTSHWLYTVTPHAFETTKFRDPLDGATLLELRGEGGMQTVFPPSVHPSSEIVTWEVDEPPATINAADLLRAGTRLAAACLVCKYNGGGHAVIEKPERIWTEALAGRPKELRDAVRGLLKLQERAAA